MCMTFSVMVWMAHAELVLNNVHSTCCAQCRGNSMDNT